VPSFVVGGLGLFALPVTLRIVGSPSFAEVVKLWPLLILFGALIVLFRPTETPSGGDERDQT
jgi:hypothetical protein